MNWKIKSILQTFISVFPDRITSPIYYSLQKHFGNIRSKTPLSGINKSIQLINSLKNCNYDIGGKIFLEVGTGWSLDVPLGLWLCGAGEVITIDKNYYLKKELVIKSVKYFLNNRDQLMDLLKNSVNPNLLIHKLDQLELCNADYDKIITKTNIKYKSYIDASRIPLEDGIVDFHYSINVLEHVPKMGIKNIFIEAKRILSDTGVMIHHISMSDHYSHTDKSISSINFLKYSDKEWSKWTNNKYNYHNRLRVNDYYNIFESMKVEILSKDEYVNQNALRCIENGFNLHERFSDRDPKELATAGLKFVGQFKV